MNLLIIIFIGVLAIVSGLSYEPVCLLMILAMVSTELWKARGGGQTSRLSKKARKESLRHKN